MRSDRRAYGIPCTGRSHYLLDGIFPVSIAGADRRVAFAVACAQRQALRFFHIGAAGAESGWVNNSERYASFS